jgi:hypothetical protein
MRNIVRVIVRMVMLLLLLLLLMMVTVMMQMRMCVYHRTHTAVTVVTVEAIVMVGVRVQPVTNRPLFQAFCL